MDRETANQVIEELNEFTRIIKELQLGNIAEIEAVIAKLRKNTDSLREQLRLANIDAANNKAESNDQGAALTKGDELARLAMDHVEGPDLIEVAKEYRVLRGIKEPEEE